jgi:hypothetical protein
LKQPCARRKTLAGLKSTKILRFSKSQADDNGIESQGNCVSLTVFLQGRFLIRCATVEIRRRWLWYRIFYSVRIVSGKGAAGISPLNVNAVLRQISGIQLHMDCLFAPEAKPIHAARPDAAPRTT